MFKWAISLAIPFAILFAGSFGVSSVSAVSDYDNVIETTETLTIVSPNNENIEDISTSWVSYIVAEPTCDSTYSEYLGALGSYPDGRWMIVLEETGEGSRQRARIVYTSDPTNDPEGRFFTDSGFHYAQLNRDPDSHGAIDGSMWIQKENGGAVTAYCDDVGNENFNFGNDAGTNTIEVFLSTYPINYPPDYEGEEIPETHTPPTPPLDWAPDINHVQSVDWKITLQDRNFNTFDPVPFTCNEGLSPVIQYDLFNNDTSEKIDSGIFSPTVPYVFQAEKYGIETEFKFIGNYYCGDAEDDPTFSHQTTYYFTLNALGSFVPDTPSCFTESFPYIDMTGCNSVIEGLVNNLSFGTINFPDWSIQSDGCHTLGTLGDWLNVPNHSRMICPQFSSTVRSIVTPFLTFVLGITIIGVLLTKSSKDTH